jgi:hypothetical protein
VATQKRLEFFVQKTRASETVAKASAQVQQRQKEDSKPMYRQITETVESTPESIWEDIDMLEGDPAHRGMAMRNTRFKNWEGLWDKGELCIEQAPYPIPRHLHRQSRAGA